MNLTKSLKQLIVDRFTVGGSIENIATWYGLKPVKVENVIREELNRLAPKGDANGTSEKT